MAALVTALSASSGLSVVCLVYFVMFFAARDRLCYLDCGQVSLCSPSYETGNWTNTSFWNGTLDASIRLFAHPVPDEVFPTVSAVTLCLTLLCSLLLAHLLAFHIYLCEPTGDTHKHTSNLAPSCTEILQKSVLHTPLNAHVGSTCSTQHGPCLHTEMISLVRQTVTQLQEEEHVTRLSLCLRLHNSRESETLK